MTDLIFRIPDLFCYNGNVFGVWEMIKTIFALLGMLWTGYFLLSLIRSRKWN